MADIDSAIGISKSTLSTIRKQADKIRKVANKSVIRIMASKTTQIRVPIMKKLERMVA
jgi:hypothetical protein